jgi:hypothetical protein
MNRIQLAIALAVAGLIPAFAATAQQAPAAADNTQGMAIMSAIVLDNGTLHHPVGVTSATRFAAGSYELVFERPITNCAATASSGALYGVNAFYSRLVNTAYTTGEPTKITVYTRHTPDLNFADATFHIIVFCAK